MKIVIMKRFLAILIGVLCVACDRPFIVFEQKSPYHSEWIVINKTGQDIRLCMEKCYVNDEGDVYVDFDKDPLLNNKRFLQEFSNDKEVCSEFLGLFLVVDELLSCRVYLTPVDSDEILKEWVWGKDNGAHDFFDESEWKHNSWEDTTTTYYTIYHNEWTFTITEADIGLSQRLYGNCIKGV